MAYVKAIYKMYKALLFFVVFTAYVQSSVELRLYGVF